ncbi:putative C6 transcription factor [Aspergillus udagawae]|uniref:C6 transcription factor n=1 Tax=Aspergillus udagawae TaxID=91492 RepID=A0ABQ1BF85_9EURO|nr:putative C6 transcription factor [Aspergillus udagawae]
MATLLSALRVQSAIGLVSTREKAYLERLEARVAELEAAARRAEDVPVGLANNTTASAEEQLAEPATGTCEDRTKSALPDVGNSFNTASHNERRHEPIYCESEARFPEPSILSDGYERNKSALREKLFRMFPEQNARKLRLEANRGPFTSSVFIQLPSKSQLQSMFEAAFTEANHVLPLFDVSVLTDLLEQHYSDPTVRPGKHPGRWAMLNATIAVAIQVRTARGSYSEMTELSWCFFKNAFSMYSVIALQAADGLGLEALLAMAIYMQGSSDVRTTSVLVCAAARLSLTFGLHRREFYSVLDPATTNRHKRAFWIAYILDRSISVKTGLPSVFDDDAINIGHPDLIMSASPADADVLGTSMSASGFRLKAELAMIEFGVEKRLYSALASKQNVHQLLNLVAEVDYQLENWKAKLPWSCQPDRIVWSTKPTIREPILLLHFAYYCTLSEIHGFAAHLDQAGDISAIRQIQSSRIIQASAASQIIHILQYLPCEQPGQLWYVYPFGVQKVILLIAS